MNVTCVKVEPPKPETKVTITLDMTLAEAVELYHELGKQSWNAPLNAEVSQAFRTTLSRHELG